MTARSTRRTYRSQFRRRSSADCCHRRWPGVESVLWSSHIPRGSSAMATFDHYGHVTSSWVELITPDQRAAQELYAGLFGWGYDDNDMGEMGHYYIATLEGSEIGGVSGQMPGM